MVMTVKMKRYEFITLLEDASFSAVALKIWTSPSVNTGARVIRS